METFYETYKYLLLELSWDDTVKRMDDPKFKRLLTGNDSLEEMDPFMKHAYGTIRSTIIKSIPHDIPEKDKANALNWVITKIIKDSPDHLNRLFIRNPSSSNRRGHELLKRQLELFYQIKQQKIDRLLPKKAIEEYGSFQEFVMSMEEIAPKYREYLAQKTEKSTKGEGQLLVYEDDNWQVYFPQTKGAACSLGKGTDWCTAAPGLDYYSNYAAEGQLIIFISKKNPNEKYQFHYGAEQYMDKNDAPVDNKLFLILNKILYDGIKHTELFKNLNADERGLIEHHSKLTKFIDKDYIFLADYTPATSGYDAEIEQSVVNIHTLKEENPYSPVVKKREKGSSNVVYFFDRKHKSNEDNYDRLMINKRGNIFTYSLIGRDEDGFPTSELYTNNQNHPLFSMGYFNTYKDSTEMERPNLKDPSLILHYYSGGHGDSYAETRIVKELPDFSKYMTFGFNIED